MMAVKVTQFFNPKPVRDMAERKNRKALMSAGALVRTIERRSMRKRKAISQPGQPPSRHEGGLHRLIVFAYDKINQSVAIGPLKRVDPLSGEKIAAILEHGGVVTRRKKIRQGRRKSREVGPRVSRTYKPRPYARPALEKAMPKLSSQWSEAAG